MEPSKQESAATLKDKLLRLLKGGAGSVVVAWTTLTPQASASTTPRADTTIQERAEQLRQQQDAPAANSSTHKADEMLTWWNWHNWRNGFHNGWHNWHNWHNWW